MGDRFFLDQDDDAHWYLVPVANRAKWEAWCNIPTYDERSWVVPEFAERLGGAPSQMTFLSPRAES